MTSEPKFAVVVMLPETDDPQRVDFISREFPDIESMVSALQELETNMPNWRLVTFCHIEDLPLLMEEPA